MHRETERFLFQKIENQLDIMIQFITTFVQQHIVAICLVATIDFIVGMILIHFAIRAWKNLSYCSKWFAIDMFITVDIPYAIATLGRRVNTKDPMRQIVQIPFELITYIAFFWILLWCKIAGWRAAAVEYRKATTY